ncbi:MAG: hypothetical protein LBK55_00590 [Azoarcus sp.]|jgi:hypothetical protein|nr:hypothetical protein [Azoarcus sp.]
MKLNGTYDHHNGVTEWQRRDLYEWLTDVFEAPAVKIQRQCTPAIREHVKNEFINEGWAIDVRLDQKHQLAVTALKDDLAFQLQTGNMSRAPYDLLKLQFLFSMNKIQAAALALPTSTAAKIIGDNIANADRVGRELKLFDRVITVPISVVAFD